MLKKGSSGGRIAPGADGASLARRVYRLSPLRWLFAVVRTHRGIGPQDVFVAAYPRSGTAWMRFMLVELLSGDATFTRIKHEAPYVGRHRATPAIVPGGGRLIKTHEPYRPYYQRAIHIVRDPRDVAVSYFHFMQRMGKLTLRAGDDRGASMDHFVDAFIRGRVGAFGTWQTHLLSWHHAADNGASDVLRLRYEDIRADTAGAVRRIGRWLGADVSAERAAEVVQACAIERMREAERFALATTPYAFDPRAVKTGLPAVREGRAGGWRDTLTPAQQRRFEAFAEGLELMGYSPASA